MNLLGGTGEDNVDVRDSSTVNLASPSTVGGHLESHNDAAVTMTGGSVGSHLMARDRSGIELSGGTVTNDFDIRDAASGQMTGGTVNGQVVITDAASLDLQGGSYLVYQAEQIDPGTGEGSEPTETEMEALKRSIERRVNASGLGLPIIQRMGNNRLLIQLAGVTDIHVGIHGIPVPK